MPGPKLKFTYEFGEREAYEAESRGFLAYAVVEMPSGAVIPVVFWDVVRLQQDLEEEIASGKPFIAQPGMIVLESVTLAQMERAVQALFAEGFFDSFAVPTPQRDDDQ
jgi:hypothetical protein